MSESRHQRLSPTQFRDWLQAHPDALLLDARSAHDFERGHIPGSVRLDGRNHEALLLRGDRARPVAITCYHGNSSQTYAQMFRDFGYACVVDLIGGREAWLRDLPEPLRTWLHEQGYADAESPGRHGNTPLMHAAWRGWGDTVAQLLALGVNLNASNGDGNSALWMACVSGDTALVQTLVQAGADVDHANSTGATSLMYAASSSKPEVVQALLDAGADPFIQTQDDYTALDMAASLPCLQILREATRHGPRQPA